MNERSLYATLALFGALVLGACGADDGAVPVDRTKPGPTMRSGENCLSCHRSGGQAQRRIWTAAGTVYGSADARLDEGIEGAKITITDATGKVEHLTSNSVGNFYTATPLVKPLRMAIEHDGKRAEMPIALDAEGACNACHSSPQPIGGAFGRIRLP